MTRLSTVLTLVLALLSAPIASATSVVAATEVHDTVVHDTVAQIPIPLEGLPIPQPPSVSAQSWILYDETFDQVLGELDPDDQRPMASTTKMMTAIVVLENATMTDRVTISTNAAEAGESEIGLYAGETMTVGDLLYALLLQSANDGAVALAEHVGGSVASFVRMMNDKAAELELENTHFANPHGLDAPGHYSSARDLLTIARYGMTLPEFAEIVKTTTYDMPPAPDGTAREARLSNELVRTYEGSFGVKTGYTDGAGLTLVAGAEREGRRIYAVVMDSDDHFADSAQLLNFGFEAFTVLSVFDIAQQLGIVRTGDDVEPALAEDPVEVFGPTGNEVVTEPRTGDGGVVVVATVNNEVIGTTGIRTDQLHALPALRDSFAWAGRYWNWLWGLEE